MMIARTHHPLPPPARGRRRGPDGCGVGLVTEVVVGKLPQPFRLGVDGGGAGEVGVEGSLLGVHRGLRGVIDDTSMNALFD